MPTRRGWGLLGAAVGLYLGGLVVGLVQLVVLGVQATLLLIGSLVWTRTRATRVSVRRRAPDRLRVGTPGRADLTVSNIGRRRSTSLWITDEVDEGRRSVRFALPPLATGGSADAAYRVPAERRGRLAIGPLTASVGDPFGLTSVSWRAAGVDSVVVHPRVHDVLPPPEGRGDDLERDDRHRRGRLEPSGEFLTLREYSVGDDLRRVHWRSTARRDTLMIRQEESRRRAPVVVLLDTREGSHDRASFEVAIEATASIASALERARRPFEVITASGRRLDPPGRRGLTGLLDTLAELEPGGPDQLTVATLSTTRIPMLVAVVGRPRARDVRALELTVTTHGLLALVTARPDASPGAVSAVPTLWCAVTEESPFPRAWNDAVLRWEHDTARRFLLSRSPR